MNSHWTSFLLFHRTMSKISEGSETSDVENETVTSEEEAKDNNCYDILYLSTVINFFEKTYQKIRECVELQ